MRLGAYSGVMAARILEQQQADKGHSAPVYGPGRGTVQADPNLVGKLAAEGWIEHNVEGGA